MYCLLLDSGAVSACMCDVRKCLSDNLSGHQLKATPEASELVSIMHCKASHE